jgi:hypothetical protein
VVAGRNSGAAGSALQGAFEKALSSPTVSPSESMPVMPPDSYDVEWYVSIDGNQAGPFSLTQAQEWVRSNAADDEIYCWSDGFDDWLLVDKVRHFRDLRGPRPASDNDLDDKTAIGAPDFDDVGGFAEPAVGRRTPQPLAAAGSLAAGAGGLRQVTNTPTPKPLFAKTLEQVEANAPTAIEEVGANGRRSDLLIQMPPSPDGKKEAELELDISEPSRVVKLSTLAQIALQDRPAPRAGNGSAGATTGAQAKIGHGSGMFGTLRANTTGAAITLDPDAPRPELLQPKRARPAIWIPIAVAAAVLVGVVGLLIYLAVGQGDGDDAPIARVGGSGDLARNYDNPITRQVEVARAEVAEKTREKVARGSTRRTSSREGGGSSGRPGAGGVALPGFDEVALGDSDAVVQGELDPDDVIRAYDRSKFQVQRCFEQALKKDPFLKAPKTQVNIEVAPSGQVTSVSIPALAGTMLGSCVTISIKKWKFRKSTKGLRTVFTVAFKS